MENESIESNAGQQITDPFDWEARYKTETALPWDIKTPAPELVAFFQSLAEEDRPRNVIEVGCGTGANALWLARQGCKVTVTEIAQTALGKAKQRANEEKISIDFQLLDICETIPVTPGTQQFAFDRGVYHIIPETKRQNFVQNLAATLATGGYWLSLAGSKDEHRENPEVGPPQLSAIELLKHIEPLFAVIKLERGSFVLPEGQTHLAWKALYQRR